MQQRASGGCWRTLQGLIDFAVVRSYLSTVGKWGRVKRRALVGGLAAAAAVAAAAPGTAAPRRIGMSDVDRLNKRFAEIIASDHRHGGQLGIEQRAAALADEALNLQNAGSATQRVRSSLSASAAAFRSSAMWAAIDGRRYDIAKAHMREAQALAEMSGGQAIKFRI